MSENQPQQRQIQLRIDESKMHSTYANTIRTTTLPDEVFLDFGVNVPLQGQQGEQILNFAVGSRIIMNWQAAKRMAIQLGDAVRKYEAAHGEIKLSTGQPPASPGAGPRLAD